MSDSIPLDAHHRQARDILFAALKGVVVPSPREAGFVGQMAFAASPPTEKQARWLAILVERYSAGASAGQ